MSGHLHGYAGRLSRSHGDTVTVHVSTSATTFDVSVFRVGASRELVWSQAAIDGVDHPTPIDADSRGCGWPAAVEFVVPDDWRSGFYEIELSAQGHRSEYAWFVVRAAPTATPKPILLVIANATYNAYNSWGGRSLYTEGKQVSFRRPFGPGTIRRAPQERDDRKARPRYRGEEQDHDGYIYEAWRKEEGYPPFAGSTGWWTYERRFVEWAEGAGYEFDYAISTDLQFEPSVIDGRRLLLGVGHDEYWSAEMRAAVERHLVGGGNYASLSGNTMFWQVRFGGPPDDPCAWMVCHKYSAHETDTEALHGDHRRQTGLWSDPVTEWPEAATLGASSTWGLYSRFGAATPNNSGGFTVYRPEHWLFEHTSLAYGDVLGMDDGVVGYETVGCRIQFDEYQLPVRMGGDFTPENNEIVAFAPSSNLMMGEYPKSISALDDQGDLEFVASRVLGALNDDTIKRIRHGNSVIVTHTDHGGPGGGTVVTIGTTDWVFGLAADRRVAQVTSNILDRLGK